MVKCYCKKDVTKILLENAAYRASLKVPESAIPTVIVNKVSINNISTTKKFTCALPYNNYLLMKL